MALFGLVHGGCHGAWCWDLLVPELRSRGHDAIAVDLPAEDASAGAREYAAVVAAGLDGADAVVLVGHSIGGLTIPLVPALRPVARLVYLCAVIPEPGRSLADQFQTDPDLSPIRHAGVSHDSGRIVFSRRAAIDLFYHDCDPAVAAWAASRVRPQAATPTTETTPLEARPDVPSSYILCTGDRAVNPTRSRALARDRLGVSAIELPGGHSPFLSRPAVLAHVLAGLA
ncbi:MAG TPA: alpha/beta hydrolase [Acidimicrobiales bacterium]